MRPMVPGRLLFEVLLGEFIGALFRGLFGTLLRALLFGVLERDGGVNGRKPSFGRELFAFELSFGDGELIGRFAGRLALFEFTGVWGRFPAVDGPRASRGEIAGA